MDKILISPRPVGSVRAPSSKSEAHRLLIVSALAALYGRGTAVREVRCTDMNEDIEATVRCLTALGAHIERRDEILAVTPIQKVPSAPVLDCGESGSTLRFLLPVVCALGSLAGTPRDFCASLVGHGRLPKRPLSPLYEELVAHGAKLSPMGSNPLTISGWITAGQYTLDGGVSSQFISGLLFALPLLQGESTVNITGRVESAPYIHMTVDALRALAIAVEGDLPSFTLQGVGSSSSLSNTSTQPLFVGGDWSGAAFFLTAGVLADKEKSITITGLDTHSRQGDKAIVDILRRMGGQIEFTHNEYRACGSSLRGCRIDATQVPDLVPILAVAAAVAEGETIIEGAARLRLKESDRLRTVTDMLTALGGDVRETKDGLIIRGVETLHGGTVDAAGDHRIAMSAAVAATRCGDATVTIQGAEAVGKSYPAFWDEFDRLTAKEGRWNGD